MECKNSGTLFPAVPEHQNPGRTLLKEKFAYRDELAKNRLLQPARKFLYELGQPIVQIQ